MENNEETVETLVFSTIDELEIQQVCAILERNNIPYIRRDSGSGSYINLYMGQSIQEKNVYINEKDYDEAIKLIETFLKEDLNENSKVEFEDVEELKEVIDEEGEEKLKEQYKKMKKSIAMLFYIVPMIGIGILTIVTIINLFANYL